ncbi:Na+/H+ antiporter NhaA [Mucilaginibacter limnophilus]|uniref:Na(+)/H(+) antiporter NhaA n=1 Tax=Mucilaginibacter limnophilus TaxID=1932778 RepID=A0A3S2XZ46_9SPHI|nr:Na+/H+ antiporter NhaA [Mucilaginibacter limnophilus]RVT98423.1 Na+/H+ antiporter NhaA [Mucilaginibacter limnophilus]
MKKSPIDHIIKPVSKFIHLEYTSGIVLFIGVLLAIIWVNSPFKDAYHHLWEIEFGIGFDDNVLRHPLHLWINDGLMAIFFFVIGLELKREFIAGELSSVKRAALPMAAALGGMLVPAAIYSLVNYGKEGAHGWGIPMATDIAFALALLSMAGKQIPTSVKVFLSALAVADDLGAVLVIAMFYSAQLQFTPLMIGGIFLLVLVIGNAIGVRHTAFYLIIGFGVWIGFLLSGVHATIAGVLVAFTIPARRKIDEKRYSLRLRELSEEFEQEIPNCSILTTPKQHEIIEHIKGLSIAAQTPLQKIESALHPWVAFVIMPVFALANSGIIIESDFLKNLANPVSIGVTVGLVIGKFTGVLLFTWLLVKSKFAELPERATWRHIVGISALAGIGFTMSLFVSSLAFSDSKMVEQAKYGILIASLIAGTAGTLLLRHAGKQLSAR